VYCCWIDWGCGVWFQ